MATSNALPGVVGRPTLTINKDGSIDCADPFGNRSHAVIDVSDPKQHHRQAGDASGIIDRVQMRYPTAGTDTEVTIQGKLANKRNYRHVYTSPARRIWMDRAHGRRPP